MSDELKVLGLFRDEAALRDHIADHLDDLELGLVVTKTEYPLNNPDGAGGRVDILALDEFDHVVVIELKRSDLSARATLHELAKYVTLLSTEARVPREAIRCIVLSTHWHELLLPLSFFAATSGVHVEGYKLVRADERVAYTAVELVPISDLPQFSPEFSVYQYLTLADRDLHMASIKGRATELPFVRLVFVLLDAPKGSLQTPFRSIVGMWRLKPDDEGELVRMTGHEVGYLFPYAFPGWEAECDALYWIADEERPGVAVSSASEERGTPEKVRNLFSTYECAGVEHIGDWPKIDLINTNERLLRQIEAVSSLSGVDRPNLYTFDQRVTPRFRPSWRRAVQAFLDFIAF
ncbi:MAG TPA: endonuclease NucS domain-containing protein, partial [Nitrospira sp.]|nr:endonuclease NucS domain-containing protein [Nitrospira sp.]